MLILIYMPTEFAVLDNLRPKLISGIFSDIMESFRKKPYLSCESKPWRLRKAVFIEPKVRLIRGPVLVLSQLGQKGFILYEVVDDNQFTSPFIREDHIVSEYLVP